MSRRKATYRRIIILVLAMTGISRLLSQVSYDTAFIREAMNTREEIMLCTDRDIYSVNEKVFFRGFYHCSATGHENFSKVLYLELVTPRGKAVVKGKYRIENQGSSGYLSIPGDLRTGTYFLRGYTRWMRNFGSSNYSYVPLKILNPYIEELLDELNEKTAEISGMYTKKLPEETSCEKPAIICQVDKQIYYPGEEITLEISSAGPGSSSSRDYCLTVVPAGLIDTLSHSESNGYRFAANDFSFKYLPDIRGVSISGSVINAEDNTPSANSRLHFSVQGKNPGYIASLTDDHGRFILTVPERTGLQEMFVAAQPEGDQKKEILIDQDFETGSLPFGAIPFMLSPTEREAATRMVLNMQLSEAFGLSDTINDHDRTDPSAVRFYGKPDLVVNLSDFVKLPTLEEVFLNIVPGVFIHYKKKEPYLKFESLNTSISLYPPLVFLDRVPVFDLKALLEVNPSRIEKIEVVHEVYVKGDLMYGGIIDITSNPGNRAEIDLPGGSYFFDYHAFHPGDLHARLSELYPGEPVSPGSASRNKDSRVPDTRNTLAWIPQLNPGPDRLINLKFTAGLNPGEYRILVRGLSGKGEFIYGLGGFRVEK